MVGTCKKLRSLILTSMLVATLSAEAQTISPVQSGARPFDLDIAAPVSLGGSDARSTEFMSDYLPLMQIAANVGLNSDDVHEMLGAVCLDPGNLTLAQDGSVRAYFIGESTLNHNSLGFSTGGSDPLGDDPQLIFPDGSSPANGQPRTDFEALVSGDFVDLGPMQAGTALDFFYLVKGASGTPSSTWSTEDNANPDGLVHAVALAPAGSPFLILGFQESSGSNNDFSDLVVALDFSQTGFKVVGSPEPSLALGSALAAFLLLAHRRRIRRPMLESIPIPLTT